MIKKKLAAVFLVLLFTGCSQENGTVDQNSNELPKKPNIIVILTDQERFVQHWPKDWAEKHLTATERLKKHGLTFTRAYTAACECTPSRAVLFTSEYYPINKTDHTPTTQGLPTARELVDIGSFISKHSDYEVVWKGKWHLSPPLKGGHEWSEKDIENVKKKYYISQWNPPDAGTAITEFVKDPGGVIFAGLSTLGGGFADNDSRFVQGPSKNKPKEIAGYGESVLEYLDKVAQTPNEKRKPFCLFISLVNPHDVWVYPLFWEAAGYKKDDFGHMGISLPNNFGDDLTTKPSVQLKARNAYNKQAPLSTRTQEIEYVNFYAYLNMLADSHINKILDALDKANLTHDTIIFRTADHGELGLSHGMREKAYTAYEEMIHIPFIVSNPKMYPEPKTTDSFYSHVDLMPTLAELTGVTKFSKYGKGISQVPVLKDPKTSVQDSCLFAFDDMFFLPENTMGSHIRAIREGDWMYAVYYSKDGTFFEYEMYNLEKDPRELHNLLYKNKDPKITAEALRLHKKLKEKIDHAQALPKDFPWPQEPKWG